MTDRSDCERARAQFPALLDLPADAAALQHVERCAACREELTVFREVLDEASRLGRDEVPDPGPAYWEGFLPSVRARISAARETAPRPRSAFRMALVAAAAMVMLAAGMTPLLVSPPTGARLDSILEDIESLPADQVEILAGQDWDPFDPDDAGTLLEEPAHLDSEEIQDTIDAVDGFLTVNDLLQDLDDDQIEELRRQIADEGIIQVNG